MRVSSPTDPCGAIDCEDTRKSVPRGAQLRAQMLDDDDDDDDDDDGGDGDGRVGDDVLRLDYSCQMQFESTSPFSSAPIKARN